MRIILESEAYNIQLRYPGTGWSYEVWVDGARQKDAFVAPSKRRRAGTTSPPYHVVFSSMGRTFTRLEQAAKGVAALQEKIGKRKTKGLEPEIVPEWEES